MLKKKLRYVSGRWTALSRFLNDPMIPLDNNRTERAFIAVALGRRNFLGARSERGTRVAAIFYSIAETARLCGVDPEAYLRYATSEALAGADPKLPHQWCPTEPSR